LREFWVRLLLFLHNGARTKEVSAPAISRIGRLPRGMVV
jgi:hypothetical protein